MNNISLLDFIQNYFDSVLEDTSDTIFDVTVTVSWDRECDKCVETDWYDKFCNALYSKVLFKKVNKYGVWIVGWSQLIKDNFELFKNYSKKYWKEEYSNLSECDEDEFIYTWIKYLHHLLSGEISKKQSEIIIDLLEICKTVKNGERYE